ncbi:MAG: UDP-N-acetylmuramoylalanyl-D-glutamyl-2,6-diaminopimelate--D-alanyl-D-alanine ligase [Alphaproteobacteria bacterium]
MTVAPPLWTSADADAATGGYSTQPWQASGVSIDSRAVGPGDLFVAIKGPRFDAHEFVAEALARAAAAAMVSRIPRGLPQGAPLLIVGDTFTGLNDLARAARKRAPAHIIAVTGSVGKTGTKDALKLALAGQGRTAASEGSLNNQWGVPLSLCRMPEDAAYGVFEIGMNDAGEIVPLSKLARPHTAIITTVEGVHTAFFKSLDEIVAAKAEIFVGMDGGTAILNRDNPFFDTLTRSARANGVARIVGFGMGETAEVRLIEYVPEPGASRLTVAVEGRPITYRLGVPGRHWAMNSLAVLAAVRAAGADVEAAAAALETMKAPKGRGEQHLVPLAGGTFTLVDESFNASPVSMGATFEVLAAAPIAAGGRRIAVLGDMLELGPDSPRIHASLAGGLIAAGIDLVCTAGRDMVHLQDALPRHMRGGHACKAENLAPLVRNLVKPGDVVAVKGSHGSRMSCIVDALLSAWSAPRSAANEN